MVCCSSSSGRCGPREGASRAQASELIGPLKFPESVGHFGEHQLRRQDKGGRTNRLRQPRGGGITQGQPHGR